MPPTITIFKTAKGVTPIKVGRRIFVSGLYWQVLPNGQNYMQEARKIARRERERTGKTLDVVFLRRHVDLVQAGFVVRGGRARKGTVALAAVAADVLGSTFIVAFALPDGRYALASAIHDAIVPDSDGVYEFEEAKLRVLELWNALSGSVGSAELQVYGPSELWPGAKPIELEDLLAGVKRAHRLRRQPALTSKSALTWLIWTVLAGSIAVGWGVWEAHRAKVASEEAVRRAQELARLRGQSSFSLSELALMRPWTSQAAVQVFGNLCTRAIGAVPVTLDGWVLLNAQCNAKATTASFARSEGRTVQGFAHAARAWRPEAGVQFSSDGDLGTLEWPMSMPPGGDEDLAPMAQRANAFMSWWQTRLVPFETAAVPSAFAPGYTPPKEASDKRLTTPHWKTVRWAIKTTQRTPTRLLAGFAQDGTRLQEVELTFGSDGQLNWSLKGELYGE
ncbi:type 4b pilus protein PilO2 [Pollutimonas bauzanensis]|uniref:Pilin accessory protein (PilO) n=1 Tax=Pollutimonas bauzanensis TaxID=658167 RepID=A0A1M5YHL6_9BURK|nr:type 4b pilus protein PilO2 [Pollutimonas bauzanensis]SHI11462.1 Pilin accessory protein (PilO) [Pollutimonas bauzanensis]